MAFYSMIAVGESTLGEYYSCGTIQFVKIDKRPKTGTVGVEVKDIITNKAPFERY